MDVDIMNQEESKLKPPSSELDSPLASVSTTGRDQSSSSSLRLRHPRSNNPKPSAVLHPSHSTTSSRHSSSADLQDIHTTMNPEPPQAPQAPNLFVGKMLSGRRGPQYAQAYTIQEEDTAPRDPDVDYDEMDVESYGPLGQIFDKGVQSNAGDNLKVGGQKNFVYKLWQMLDDASTKTYIDWNSDGSEFTVFNQEDFARIVLLHYFKHSNFSSFVRQLNMYDFHKTNRAPRSTRGAPQQHHWTFSHRNFRRGRADLLPAIKRKAADGPMSTTQSQYAEDSYASQAQLDRRASVSAGIRSPPNGRTMDHDAIINDLQRQNDDLYRRLSDMERGYKELTEKLDYVIQRLPAGPARPPLSLRGTTPSLASNVSSAQHAPSHQPATLPFNVPVSLDMQQEFARQSQVGPGLPSSTMDSQSRTHSFESNVPFSPTATSGHGSMQGVPLTSQLASMHVNSSSGHMSMQGTSPSDSVAPMSYAGPSDLNPGMTGSSSSYSSQQQQHQESPVSSQHLPFLGIESFNGNLNSGYQTTTSTPLGQFFTESSIFGAFSPGQSRIHLGSRNNPVTKTPAPPKGQPPDTTGYLYR